MTIVPKAVAAIAAVTATAACGLAGCDRSPGKTGAGSQPQSMTSAATEAGKSMEAKFQAPPLPDPSRTDPEAVAMRQKYVDWKVAQVKAANDVAQKQTQQFYGAPPKGNDGKMSEGLPQLPADKK